MTSHVVNSGTNIFNHNNCWSGRRKLINRLDKLVPAAAMRKNENSLFSLTCLEYRMKAMRMVYMIMLEN